MTRVHENFTYIEGDPLIVNWYGKSYRFDHAPLESIPQYIERMIEVTPEEVELNGFSTLTSGGKKNYVRRLTCHIEIPTNEVVPLPELSRFNASLEGGLIKVSARDAFPHEVVAHGSAYLQQVIKNLMNLADDTRIILSPQPTQPIFLGHKDLIHRLSIELPRPHRIATVRNDTIRLEESNVEL